MTEKQEELLESLALAVHQLIAGSLPDLPRILELIESALKDGSLSVDFRGREECRTFVLGDNGGQADMFGSSSIEGWLQLQLSNKKLTMKLRDLYSDKDRLSLYYKEDSISMNPVLRQTFLMTVEAFEEKDIERLTALDLKKLDEAEKSRLKKLNRQKSSKSKTDKETVSTKRNKTPNVTAGTDEQANVKEVKESKEGLPRMATITTENASLELLKSDGKRRRTSSCPNLDRLVESADLTNFGQDTVFDQGHVESSEDRNGGQHRECNPELLAVIQDLITAKISDDESQAITIQRASSTTPVFDSNLVAPFSESETDANTTGNTSKTASASTPSGEDAALTKEPQGALPAHAQDEEEVVMRRDLNTVMNRFKKGHRRSVSDTIMSPSAPTPWLMTDGANSDEVDSVTDSIGAWSRILPATNGSLPRPRHNQSIISYLTESAENVRISRQKLNISDGSSPCPRAQLDRENAHFILSDAVIATVEQITYETRKRLREMEQKKRRESEEKEDRSSGRTSSHKKKSGQRSKSDSCRKERRKTKKRHEREARLEDSVLTDQSGSSNYSSVDFESDRHLDSNDEEFSRFEKGSRDFAGLLEDIPEGSAEGIALNLLGQVGAFRLPPADQILWLVSEDDAPQSLLPMPSAVPVDQEAEDLKGATELRGNLSWAPPRPQLVLTVQSVPRNRNAAMFAQKFQCRGCGLKVEQKYAKSFRFCHYLGKYFCTGCHEDQTSWIPAKIFMEWDFKRYAVSNFSLKIINSVFKEPLFQVNDLNPELCKKIEKVRAVITARSQMQKIIRYISSCKNCSELYSKMEAYKVEDVYLFSLEELYQTRFEKLGKKLRNVIQEGLDHVKDCVLCQARGFLCEGCHSGSPIFPFQTGVTECEVCFSCFHRHCHQPAKGCSKCYRINLRRQLEPVPC